MLAGVSLNEYGLIIPSPFVSLELTNSQITSMTTWTLTCVVGGDAKKKINIAAFEALLYSSAQAASQYANSSGIPVSFLFGWLDDSGNVAQYLSYQGFTINFSVATTGLYMTYTVTGYASLSVQNHMPVLQIPAVYGFVQPSAVVEALATAVKATTYYQLDIDHNDTPTLVNHGPLTTSFNAYVRGIYTGNDDYDTFPGLLRLSKSYNTTRSASGLKGRYPLNTLMNNTTPSQLAAYMAPSNTDGTAQCSSFSYWVDEPTMTKPGVIHYKSNAGIIGTGTAGDVLQYGTDQTNILSLNGNYNGVAYNISNMNFSQVGFNVDGSGNSIAQGSRVVNSWSAALSDVFQAANIMNDVNALATQFSGDFTIQIPGSVNAYTVAQPVSLLVVSGGTVSPVTGVYSIVSVTHDVANSFITTLKVQRLVMSTANQVAASQGILVGGAAAAAVKTDDTTSNVVTPYYVDFGTIYPTFEYMTSLAI
jgi:hypothetical protein